MFQEPRSETASYCSLPSLTTRNHRQDAESLRTSNRVVGYLLSRCSAACVAEEWHIRLLENAILAFRPLLNGDQRVESGYRAWRRKPTEINCSMRRREWSLVVSSGFRPARLSWARQSWIRTNLGKMTTHGGGDASSLSRFMLSFSRAQLDDCTHQVRLIWRQTKKSHQH
jgi:hypothetical protein